MPLEFGAGLVVRVVPPAVPVIRAAPPAPGGAVVVPVIGPQGPAGPAGGSAHTHTQGSPAASWLITHNLGRYPKITVKLATGARVLAEVIDIDTSALSVVFATPQSGTAYLS